MNDEELKKCPFCGGKAHLKDTAESYYWIECESCGIKTQLSLCKLVPIDEWNRRTDKDGG